MYQLHQLLTNMLLALSHRLYSKICILLEATLANKLVHMFNNSHDLD